MNAQATQLQGLTVEQVSGLYQQVFSTPEGQLVLEDLKQWGYFYQTTYLPGDASDTTIYREGARSMVMKILSHLEPLDKSSLSVQNTLEQEKP